MKDTEKLLATVVGVLNTLRDKYKIVEKNDDFIKLEMKKHYIFSKENLMALLQLNSWLAGLLGIQLLETVWMAGQMVNTLEHLKMLLAI